MRVAEVSIRRPVMTTLVMLGILIFGMMAYFQLPVSDLPNVDFPFIMVQAALPGASPETMASSVAMPLERQFSTIAGVNSMSSSNTEGFTQIVIQFAMDRDIDAAAQDVQAAISKTLSQLPPDMPTPPSYQKVNPADQPILYIALTSKAGQLPMSTLHEYGDTVMAQQIATVSGVAQVMVYGSKKYAVRVQLDPQALASRGITLAQVAEALKAGNVNLPTGTLYGPYQAFTVQAEGQLKRAAEYEKLIIAYRNDAPVYLRDVGRAIDGVENDKTAAWYVDSKVEQPSIVLAVQRQPGTNTVEVATAVKQLLPKFQSQLPQAMTMNVLYDRSVSIEESVNDVKFTLVLTLGLVVMVIFLFLRNLSATLIPSLAMPMSIVGTFALLYYLGYSLDNLSLMALTLCVGFVVDDAIVMLENIVRHMDMGKTAFQAALDGSKEIAYTIVSMTLALTAVFIPVLFMPGIVGRLFQEFAVTIAIAVLVSGVVSLTLTPMLSSRFIRSHATADGKPRRHNWAYRASEAVFNAALKFYDVTLTFALRHRLTTLGVALAVLVGSVYLFIIVPKSFIPSEDRAIIFAQTEAKEDISFESMVDHQRAFNRVIQAEPDVESFMSLAAAGQGMSGKNAGLAFLRLKPKSQRARSVDQIIADLRPKLAQVPGLKVFMLNPPSLQTDSRRTKAKYQFTLQAPDTASLYKAAGDLLERVEKIPGLVDVNSDLQLKNRQVRMDINRDKASSRDVTAAAIQRTLYDAYGGRQVSTIFTSANQYKVIMEVAPEFQRDPNALSLLYVPSGRGTLVPIKEVATLTTTVGPLSVNHQGQLAAVTLSYNLMPGTPESVAQAAVQKAADDVLPDTVTGSFVGTAEQMQKSQAGLLMLLGAAVLVIYLVLGILYESFLHPITILSVLPFAGFGALLTLLIFHVDLSIYAFVGIIMLIGLVKKNGIMMVDFAIEKRRDGLDATHAIYQASLIRFRPIMMTTVSTLAAALPIAMGYGAGAEVRRPLGLAVVGGLIFSQALTLYVTPVFYVYMDKLASLLAGRKHKDAPQIKGEPLAQSALERSPAAD